jgi:hypothetical protein
VWLAFCADILEILYLHLDIKMFIKLHTRKTGRLYMQNSLARAHFFRPTYAVAKWILWTVSAELWILWTGVPTYMTDRQYLCDQTFNANRRIEHCAIGTDLKLALYLIHSCSYQVSGVQFIRNSRKTGKWLRCFYWFILYFPNLCRPENWNRIEELPQYC